MKALVVLAALGGVAHADAGDSFRAAAKAIGARSKKHVVDVTLGATMKVAVLAADDKVAPKGDDISWSCHGKPCRGGYVIERPGDLGYWYVEFDDDWMPTTKRVADDTIHHDQLHIGGTTSIEIAVRGGKLVVLRFYDEHRRNDWVDDRTFTAKWPELASFKSKIADYTSFKVSGFPK